MNDSCNELVLLVFGLACLFAAAVIGRSSDVVDEECRVACFPDPVVHCHHKQSFLLHTRGVTMCATGVKVSDR